ncbi:hypothetical protein NXS19_014467 [Fusarium pseudograminearum]|nr:hypothetical protein NXS19_014467 [Fusarium pseudograminearum]
MTPDVICSIRSQTVRPYLDVLYERPGDASFDPLIDVVPNISILIDVLQVETVGLRDTARATKACLPAPIFDPITKPFSIVIYGPVDRFGDRQICQVHYRR